MKYLSIVSTGLTLLSVIVLIYLKFVKKKDRAVILTKTQQSVMDLTNIIDIRDHFLYSKDGKIFTYLKIAPVSLDLLSEREKDQLSRTLSAELSRETKPFKLLALSRPIDISPLIDEYSQLHSMSKDEKQRQLLIHEMEMLKDFMNSEEVVVRQFFIVIWEKYHDGIEADFIKRAKDFALSFQNAGVRCELLKEDEIITLINMIHNPAYIHLEDTDYQEYIPKINLREGI